MSYWKRLVKFLTNGLSVAGLEDSVASLDGSGVRAKDSRGRYVADYKSTVDVNEAYKDGKTPTKKNKRTRTKNKYKGVQKSKSQNRRGRPRGSTNKKK